MRKNILLIGVLLAFFISCNDVNKNTVELDTENSTEEKLSILGVWERTSFYNYDETGKIKDSFASSEDNRHIKIFTPSKVMWCRNISADSSEWFGFGSYKLTDSLLTETLKYGSVEMSKFIAVNPEFVFHYNLEKEKFSQIQIDSLGHPLFAENYIRLE